MLIITNPAKFDVVVTENFFGDILSDESSVLSGTLGVMPSASHSAAGPSLYEPIHGSAPDIAGQGIANPISMILSVAMMLRDSFAELEAAEAIEAAVEKTLAQGICRHQPRIDRIWLARCSLFSAVCSSFICILNCC